MSRKKTLRLILFAEDSSVIEHADYPCHEDVQRLTDALKRTSRVYHGGDLETLHKVVRVLHLRLSEAVSAFQDLQVSAQDPRDGSALAKTLRGVQVKHLEALLNEVALLNCVDMKKRYGYRKHKLL